MRTLGGRCRRPHRRRRRTCRGLGLRVGRHVRLVGRLTLQWQQRGEVEGGSGARRLAAARTVCRPPRRERHARRRDASCGTDGLADRRERRRAPGPSGSTAGPGLDRPIAARAPAGPGRSADRRSALPATHGPARSRRRRRARATTTPAAPVADRAARHGAEASAALAVRRSFGRHHPRRGDGRRPCNGDGRRLVLGPRGNRRRFRRRRSARCVRRAGHALHGRRQARLDARRPTRRVRPPTSSRRARRPARRPGRRSGPPTRPSAGRPCRAWRPPAGARRSRQTVRSSTPRACGSTSGAAGNGCAAVGSPVPDSRRRLPACRRRSFGRSPSPSPSRWSRDRRAAGPSRPTAAPPPSCRARGRRASAPQEVHRSVGSGRHGRPRRIAAPEGRSARRSVGARRRPCPGSTGTGGSTATPVIPASSSGRRQGSGPGAPAAARGAVGASRTASGSASGAAGAGAGAGADAGTCPATRRDRRPVPRRPWAWARRSCRQAGPAPTPTVAEGRRAGRSGGGGIERVSDTLGGAARIGWTTGRDTGGGTAAGTAAGGVGSPRASASAGAAWLASGRRRPLGVGFGTGVRDPRLRHPSVARRTFAAPAPPARPPCRPARPG